MKYTHIISILSILGALTGGTGMAVAGVATSDAERSTKMAVCDETHGELCTGSTSSPK